jgi:hypothetical protein
MTPKAALPNSAPEHKPALPVSRAFSSHETGSPPWLRS